MPRPALVGGGLSLQCQPGFQLEQHEEAKQDPAGPGSGAAPALGDVLGRAGCGEELSGAVRGCPSGTGLGTLGGIWHTGVGLGWAMVCRK